MIRLFIKEFTLIICVFYTYSRILNIPNRKYTKYILSNIIISIILTGISYILDSYISDSTITFQLAISAVFLAMISSTKLELSFSTTVISFGITYVLYVISVVIISIFFALLDVPLNADFIYPQALSAILLFLLTVLLFKIKRLKKGMPFLQNSTSNNFIFYISLLVLFAYIIFSNNNSDLIYLLPVILIIFSSFFIYISWKKHITKSYLQKLHTRQVNTLQEELKVQATIIAELENNLDSFSKIVHKDNKIIPSMAMAVNNYLQHLDFHSDLDQQKKIGVALIEELNRISQERKGILTHYELSNQKLISTNIVSINALMHYMLQKAKDNGIRFELKGSKNIETLLESNISEDDLNTLLADLIENAIIATKECDKRNILVDATMINEIYCINIFDSGTPFSSEVLKHWGKKRITTHKDTNGSGIGLITTYELLKKYKASFSLEEFENNEMFTKKLSILFDHGHHFTILSPRASSLSECINRPDLNIAIP